MAVLLVTKELGWFSQYGDDTMGRTALILIACEGQDYFFLNTQPSSWEHPVSCLTLRLLMSYIYGAPSKARNANVVYIWTYVWQR